MCAVYIRNRCYSKRLEKTPYEAFIGHKPNLANMHVFGTICFSYVQEKKKLDARGERGVFLGYDKESPAYLIYYPESGAIGKSRCVRFTGKLELQKNACDVPCQTEPQIVEGEKGLPNTAESPGDDSGGNTTQGF